MKIFAYEVRADEIDAIKRMAEKYQLTIDTTKELLTKETLKQAEGYDAVSVISRSMVNKEVLDGLAKQNISYLATRCVGYDHIDIAHAHKLGIKVCNSLYPPNSVADFIVMLMLMALRNVKLALMRAEINDYSLAGLKGKEMKDLTIGIIGTGRIGRTVIKNLSGFGCKIVAYDSYIDENVKKYAQYVEMDELLQSSDLISLHIPLTEENHHMIGKEAIDKMKDGVVLVNCARGGLMDTEALIEGIENKKIGALALDVLENEEGIYHFDKRLDIVKNKNMAYLRQFPNVVLTHHIAFFTDAAVNSMVEHAVEGLVALMQGKQWKSEII